MGQIGRFVDAACAAHPALMRKVLDRPFGDLRNWVDFDEEGETCGCLIGTMALCNGYDAAAADPDSTTIYAARAIWPDAQEWGAEDDEAERVGMTVYDVAVRLSGIRRWWDYPPVSATAEGNAVAVEVIKRRIARRLGVTYAVPAVGVQHA
jgi:hypothetical protein